MSKDLGTCVTVVDIDQHLVTQTLSLDLSKYILSHSSTQADSLRSRLLRVPQGPAPLGRSPCLLSIGHASLKVYSMGFKLGVAAIVALLTA